MTITNKLTYKDSGVNYETIDYIKEIAQQSGEKTINNLPKNYQEVSASRGESAHVVDASHYFASVIEGLGTKSLVADEMYKLNGKLIK